MTNTVNRCTKTDSDTFVPLDVRFVRVRSVAARGTLRPLRWTTRARAGQCVIFDAQNHSRLELIAERAQRSIEIVVQEEYRSRTVFAEHTEMYGIFQRNASPLAQFDLIEMHIHALHGSRPYQQIFDRHCLPDIA